MKIMLTAFDAFGGQTINPAQQAVQKVQAPEGVELVRVEVPTVFGKSIQVVTEAMEREHPDAVLCVGQAGGRAAVTPERVAINIMDARIPDNEGNQPEDQPVVPGGENALFSTLPVKAMTAAIQKQEIPAQLSNTAGTFVCNQLLYGVLHLCQQRFPETQAAFIHVPFLPQQAKNGEPSLPLEQMVKALEAVLVCIEQERRFFQK